MRTPHFDRTLRRRQPPFTNLHLIFFGGLFPGFVFDATASFGISNTLFWEVSHG
jgi:hypothetical protein